MARILIVEDSRELAALLGAATRSRGYEVTTVHTGREALDAARSERFGAAVVDLLLPDLRGGEVLKGLREQEIPCVAISGVFKGERLAREAMDAHGARAFFEKPFELESLLATLEGLAGVPDSGQRETEEEDALDELSSLPPVEVEPLPFADRERVWDRAAGQEAPALAPKAEEPVPSWSRSGSLAESPVPRLLTAFYQARHSGELKLKSKNVLKVVYIESGRPAYAASNLASERFARFCVQQGVLSLDRLEEVARYAKENELRTGEAMVRLGILDADQRRELLEAQIRHIVWSTFSWDEGSFSFAATRPRRTDLVKLAVFPGDLILEGMARVGTLVGLRKALPDELRLFPTPDPPYMLHELELSSAQAMLLVQADGSKSVGDLLTLTELPERDVRAFLRALDLCGIVEPKVATEPPRTRISFGL